MPAIAELADRYQDVAFVAIHSASHFTNKDDVISFLQTKDDTSQTLDIVSSPW